MEVFLKLQVSLSQNALGLLPGQVEEQGTHAFCLKQPRSRQNIRKNGKNN